MILLIDTVNTGSPGAYQLVQELARAARLCCPEDWEIVFLRPPDFEGVDSGHRMKVVTEERSGGWLALNRWITRWLPDRIRKYDADVVYSLSGFLSRKLVTACGTVNSVNNMLPFSPELIREYKLLSKDRIRLPLLRWMYVRSSRMADAVVMPSRLGLQKLTAHTGKLKAGTFIAMNSVPEYVRFDPENPPPNPYGERPFLFYLSVVRPYKNHLNLIEAYRRALLQKQDLPDMLFAGPPDDAVYVERIRRAVGDGGLAERVKYLGRIPRNEIPGFLHHATVNLFPSLCETNSFVQSEILGAGGVMACSNLAPMPEVAGEAAELFDPHDPDDMARVLVRLCSDEGRRQDLRRLAARRVEDLSPQACGTQIWGAVRHAFTRYQERAHR